MAHAKGVDRKTASQQRSAAAKTAARKQLDKVGRRKLKEGSRIGSASTALRSNARSGASASRTANMDNARARANATASRKVRTDNRAAAGRLAGMRPTRLGGQKK